MAELDSYARKRDFAHTPEPDDAGPAASGERLRFVVQEHHARRLHWDLRLERDGVLKSWAVPNGIPPEPGSNRKAIPTEDHPLEYVDFQGEIPAGNYGAGTMRIWDTGSYDCEKWDESKIVVTFHGERLEGTYAMFKTRDQNWMIHRSDPPQSPIEPMPAELRPMLATAGELPRGDAWAHEIKWDGVRAIARYEPGRLHLFGRGGDEITAQYPEIAPLSRALGSRTAILDGEIIAFAEDGRPSFERLQQRLQLSSPAQIRRRAQEIPVQYAIFDLLYLEGRNLTALPYSERRELLESLQLAGAAWSTPSSHRGDGTALLKATAERGLEGVISKRLAGRYEPGRRSRAWIKVKHVQREVLAIGGWLPGTGRRAHQIGALLVGEPGADRQLRYAGRVGSGFTNAELDRLQGMLDPLRRSESPFERGGRPPRGSVWVEPVHTARVEFTEWTRQRQLRHPVYKGIAAAEPGPQPKFSNLDKVLFPRTGFTKGDLIDYYRAVAPVLLAHLKDRPLTMKRYPDGVEGKFFYEKRCPEHRPDWVQTAEVWSRQNKANIPFCLLNDRPSLLWAANLADIELHTSLATAFEPDRPTALVFDLDPGAPASVVECCEVALELRDLFEQLQLQSVVKTSGSKGLQLYVPLNTPTGYERTKPFARAVGELLEKRRPELIVSRMSKDLRGGKVLIDWSQNDRHKTTVNVYSVRALERPTVSTPITWSEVEATAGDGDGAQLTFETADVLARIAQGGDPFAPMLTLVQPLPEL